jgi:hypothetical protein
MNSTMDKIAKGIARALPRRVVFWAAVRVMFHATRGRWSGENPIRVTAFDALRRWNFADRWPPESVVGAVERHRDGQDE